MIIGLSVDLEHSHRPTSGDKGRGKKPLPLTLISLFGKKVVPGERFSEPLSIKQILIKAQHYGT